VYLAQRDVQRIAMRGRGGPEQSPVDVKQQQQRRRSALE
jgi:hypothetical protein